MDPHALEVLEFGKVRDLLAEAAASALGLEAAAALQPLTEEDQIRLALQHTSEARSIFDGGDDIPLGGLHDLRPLLHQASIGSVLLGEELLAVAQTLGCVAKVKHFFAGRDAVPALGRVAGELVDLPAVAAEIVRCIGDDGEVLDDASAELRRLRRLARQLADQVQATLRRLLGSLAGDEAVQEAVVTIRQGRYCIPVKSSFQGRFDGIVHDRSASGQTVFMEPTSVVRLNNELREATLGEQQEVYRILSGLSRQVGDSAPLLGGNLALLRTLDLARAKGRLSRRLGGVEPELSAGAAFDLRRARHPLLEARAGAERRIPLCEQVYADIGDEQSLEQSLSTFGSHLTQIVRILRSAGEGALVLLDELGAGTDPVEGAALAEAVLAALHARGCLVAATTHHGSLKAFAYRTDGVENASVEFDSATLGPTYRLLTGIPGASHAFEIATRLGVPEEVLAEARALLPEEHHEAADIIVEMQARQRRIETELQSAEHEAAAASHSRRELERERKRLRELEVEIRERARREAEALLAKVQAEADGILAELRRAEREGRATEQARQRLRNLREESRGGGERLAPGPAATPEAAFGEGDVVEVLRLERQGQVVAVEENGELQVQVGPMRMTVEPGDVALVKRGDPRTPTVSRHRVEVAPGFALELHLRGKLVDDALIELDRYLDQALLANVPDVRIVHGKGTGALRRAVWQYLREHPHVKRFEHPPEALGGGGVTVVKLEL
ncbi:MAG: Smr/MutS family protein [Armatimonadetes bacterium]|nr:Smr/MutS family protein [Armatimonadota bacterium]